MVLNVKEKRPQKFIDEKLHLPDGRGANRAWQSDVWSWIIIQSFDIITAITSWNPPAFSINPEPRVTPSWRGLSAPPEVRSGQGDAGGRGTNYPHTWGSRRVLSWPLSSLTSSHKNTSLLSAPDPPRDTHPYSSLTLGPIYLETEGKQRRLCFWRHNLSKQKADRIYQQLSFVVFVAVFVYTAPGIKGTLEQVTLPSLTKGGIRLDLLYWKIGHIESSSFPPCG